MRPNSLSNLNNWVSLFETTQAFRLIQRVGNMSMICLGLECKFCNSKNIIRYGHFKNSQRWWCKDCHRKFAANDALPGMKTPTHQIASALNMYYNGMSLNAISRQLERKHNIEYSDSTIYKWISKYTNNAIYESGIHYPEVGDNWFMDITAIKISGKKYWVIDIFDSYTCFLLATEISSYYDNEEIKSAIVTAIKRAYKKPERVITCGYHNQPGSIGINGSPASHFTCILAFDPLSDQDMDSGYIHLIESWHGALKGRSRVMENLKSKNMVQLILSGWSIYYNYFRTQDSLGGQTPAEKAGDRWTEPL